MKKGKHRRVLPACIIIALVFAIPCFGATTQEEIQEAQQEREEATASLLTIQERIEAVESKQGETRSYLQELDTQLEELTSELKAIQEQYKEKQLAYDQASQELVDAELNEETQRENMALRIQYIYENSTDAGLLEAVFSAESFSELLNRASHMAELSQYDRNLLEQYIAICEEVEVKRLAAEEEWNAVIALQEQCEEKRDDIQLLYDSAAEELEKLEKSLASDEKEEAKILEKIKEQEDRIAALYIQAAVESSYQASTGGTGVHVQAVQNDAGETEFAVVSDSGETVTTVSANEAHNYVNTSTWDGPVLTEIGGVNQGPSGKETWYSENIDNVVQIMRNMGNEDEYWVRDDGVKMLGDYVIVAANLQTHPRGSIVESSLGTAIVCDTGGFAAYNPEQLDIAVNW